MDEIQAWTNEIAYMFAKGEGWEECNKFLHRKFDDLINQLEKVTQERDDLLEEINY